MHYSESIKSIHGAFAMNRKWYITVSTLLFLSFTASAQSSCDAPEYRQFDFWIGEWTVTQNNGDLAGTNRITSILDGCVIKEDYHTPSGFAGQSLNSYDRQTKQWIQTWMDNSGLVLRLSGVAKSNGMVLSGEGRDRQGRAIVHRITWSLNDDGTVNQHWQMKLADSAQWSTLFNGTYTKSPL